MASLLAPVGLCSRERFYRISRGSPHPLRCDPENRRTCYLAYGSAKTYIAFPVAGGCRSGAMVAGTSRGLPPPLPVVTPMYCLPLMLNDIGKPCTEVARRVSHSTFPVLTSNALNLRSRSPANTTPPAVEIAAVINGARCSYDHNSFMVRTS